MAIRRETTSVGYESDPRRRKTPKKKISIDDFTDMTLAMGAEGYHPDFDPDAFEVDEASIRPRKTLRGTGFPAEDAPFDGYDDFEMMPEPFEPYESDLGRDPYTGEMIEMPGLKEGDGRMWSRGKLLPTTPSKGIVGLDGITRTPEELERLRSTKDARDKERGARSPYESSGLLTPYTGTVAERFGS